MPRSRNDVDERGRKQSPTNLILVFVDGEADALAIRALLDRWLEICGLTSWGRDVKKVKKTHVNERDIDGLAGGAIAAYDPRAILFVTDDDGRCQEYENKGKRLGPALLEQLTVKEGKTRAGVVIARYCFEAWLLAVKLDEVRNVDEMYDTCDKYIDHLDRIEKQNKAKGGHYKPKGKYKKTRDQMSASAELPFADPMKLQHMIDCSYSYNNLLVVLEELTGCHIASEKAVLKKEAIPDHNTRLCATI